MHPPSGVPREPAPKSPWGSTLRLRMRNPCRITSLATCRPTSALSSTARRPRRMPELKRSSISSDARHSSLATTAPSPKKSSPAYCRPSYSTKQRTYCPRKWRNRRLRSSHGPQYNPSATGRCRRRRDTRLRGAGSEEDIARNETKPCMTALLPPLGQRLTPSSSP